MIAVDLGYHRGLQQRIASGRATQEQVESAHEILLAELERIAAQTDGAKEEFLPGFCGSPYDWEQPGDNLADAVEESKSGEAFARWVTPYRQVAGA